MNIGFATQPQRIPLRGVATSNRPGHREISGIDVDAKLPTDSYEIKRVTFQSNSSACEFGDARHRGHRGEHAVVKRTIKECANGFTCHFSGRSCASGVLANVNFTA